jgi:hypothetical protein
MKKIKFFFIVFILTVLMFSCKYSQLTIEYNGKSYQEGDRIIVEGRMAVIGSEPFTELVLIDENDERFMIPEEDRKKLTGLKADTIQITGRLKIKELKPINSDKSVYIKYIKPKKIDLQ